MTEAVSVLVASRDLRTIAAIAPAVARQLYPGRRIGAVLAVAPHADPEWLSPAILARTRGDWSAVALEVITDAEYRAWRRSFGIPADVPDPLHQEARP
jgi:hypothetical protein